MGAVYRSICNEADTLLLLVANLTEKQIKLKLTIEKLMNGGFVSIAKARYIMGSTCVTKMQLPTENSHPIKPLATVFKKKTNEGWIFYINRTKCLSNSESLNEVSEKRMEMEDNSSNNSNTNTNAASKSEAAFKNILQNEPKSLRKSKNAYLVSDESYQTFNDELLDELSNSGSNESLISVTDPIRLFGILVPSALKEAQVTFNSVVDLLGECATVQLELREALNKFSHLEKVKKLIEAASKETKIDVLTPRVYWTASESSCVSSYSDTEKDEGIRKEEELSESSKISIKKSIRSVFFDSGDFESQERELSVWGSGNSEPESEN